MQSHLDIKVERQSLTLPKDFSIDVTEENPLFNDNGMYSTPVQVPMEGNRHVFKNVDDSNSDLRPVSMEHLPADIAVSGLPFRHGTVVVQEDEELKDSFSFNIDESTQSFSDLIGDLKCQDVPLYNNEKIPIGQKVCDVNIDVTFTKMLKIVFSSGATVEIDSVVDHVSGTFDPQALGFSYPGIATSQSGFINASTAAGITEKSYPNGIVVKVPKVIKSYINVTEPYQSQNGVPAADGWRYCNARVCYAHHGLDTAASQPDTLVDGKLKYAGTIGATSEDTMKVGEHYGDNEDYGPYWVLDADRPQSGICFYVLYFLDCLFNHLGVTFDNSALTRIEDLRRLCFFTTKCKFMTDTSQSSERLTTITAINKWLDDRGCGGRVEVPEIEEKQIDEDYVTFNGVKYRVGELLIKYLAFGHVKSFKMAGQISAATGSAYVRTMYATNENFPDESVKTILESLEASFGIRFHYDYQLRKVTAYLLRDVFRRRDHNGDELPVITLPCEVLEVNKLSEKITGVRMKYSAEGEASEQQRNVRTGKRDYDTDFDYVDYRQGRTSVSDGYTNIAKDLHTENVTCYVDRRTANAYRFKISKDLSSSDVKYHRLFEVGQFKGIEVGDCSPMNESYVEELVSDFQPMSFNDVNAYAELVAGSKQSILAAYVDEDMEHEFVTQRINNPVYSGDIDIYGAEVLRLVESYDPSQTDDGNSPLQSYDWGLAIAIMRGGGTDAEVIDYSDGYDGFGNSKWRTVGGKYAMASDTMDQFGNLFDYNGTIGGLGGGERFSLKIRSYKPFVYYIDSTGKTIVSSDLSLEGKSVEGVSGKTWLVPCNGTDDVFRRGLADRFMAEYIWFLLHRKKYRIHLLAEPAALIDIPNHWSHLFRIGQKTGYIDQLKYTISRATGIGEVTVDFYAV